MEKGKWKRILERRAAQWSRRAAKAVEATWKARRDEKVRRYRAARAEGRS